MFPIRICIFQICKIRIRQHQIEHSLFTITITKRLLEKYKKEVSYTFSDLGSGSVFFFSSLLNSQFSDHLIYQFSIINFFLQTIMIQRIFRCHFTFVFVRFFYLYTDIYICMYYPTTNLLFCMYPLFIKKKT